MASLASGFLGPAFSDPDTARILTDESVFRTLLEVEVALARALAAAEVIPRHAATRIERAADGLPFDRAALGVGVERDGTPVAAVVHALRQRAGDAGPFVHWGATSQDIMDTATVLQVRQVLGRFESLMLDLMSGWAELAEAHRGSIMPARSHGGQAAPTCFGLKVALWLSPLVRHFGRLSGLRSRVLRAQFGGAAGTLASLGPAALAVSAGFARELALREADVPWHTQRDGFAELGGWASSLSGSLGKVAQDVILLSQSEVGEVAEVPEEMQGAGAVAAGAAPVESGEASQTPSGLQPAPPPDLFAARPQRNNPMLSAQIVAAARHNAALLSSLHHALVQEQERASHGWQLEWLTLSPMLNLTGGALRNALQLTSGLRVFPERMAENLERTQGLSRADHSAGQQRRSLLEVLEAGLTAEARQRAAASGAGLPSSRPPPPASPVAPGGPSGPRSDIDLGQASVFIDRVLESAHQYIAEAAP